ncbi:exonuclease SbcC [Geodermatophilus sp. TF02-6]|nr:exonuclease SbcC [Geodermatophilus sp. TF02-6]
MTTASGDFDLTMDELRAVAHYVAKSAEGVYPFFAEVCPDDPRPRAAIDAAWQFINGARRSNLQRMTSLDAHRAAREAPTEAARLAARAAGDAASAAYLHPIAQGRQVGHILRAAACTARIRELTNDDPLAGASAIEDARRRATPVLIDVLNRYPEFPRGWSRVEQLMSVLDSSLRTSR